MGEGGGKGGNLQRRVKGWKRSVVIGGACAAPQRWGVASLTEAGEQVRAVTPALGNGDTRQRLRSVGVRTPEPPERSSVASASNHCRPMPSARDVRVLSRLGRGVVLAIAGRRPISMTEGNTYSEQR